MASARSGLPCSASEDQKQAALRPEAKQAIFTFNAIETQSAAKATNLDDAQQRKETQNK
jgi:hypothetical protein